MPMLQCVQIVCIQRIQAQGFYKTIYLRVVQDWKICWTLQNEFSTRYALIKLPLLLSRESIPVFHMHMKMEVKNFDSLINGAFIFQFCCHLTESFEQFSGACEQLN